MLDCTISAEVFIPVFCDPFFPLGVRVVLCDKDLPRCECRFQLSAPQASRSAERALWPAPRQAPRCPRCQGALQARAGVGGGPAPVSAGSVPPLEGHSSREEPRPAGVQAGTHLKSCHQHGDLGSSGRLLVSSDWKRCVLDAFRSWEWLPRVCGPVASVPSLPFTTVCPIRKKK